MIFVFGLKPETNVTLAYRNAQEKLFHFGQRYSVSLKERVLSD